MEVYRPLLIVNLQMQFLSNKKVFLTLACAYLMVVRN